MAKSTTKSKSKAAPKAKKVQYPDKLTANSISQFIAEKHEIPKKQAKEVIEDLFELIQAGVLKGERVPIGKIGKVFVRVRPATKARLGRNPMTGEEITIPAKKATKVPKFSFTKNFKEEAKKAKVVAKKK